MDINEIVVSVRPAATAAGITLSELQRRVALPMATVRRYWHGTRDGAVRGEPLGEVSLPILLKFSRVLGVPPSEFFFVRGADGSLVKPEIRKSKRRG